MGLELFAVSNCVSIFAWFTTAWTNILFQQWASDSSTNVFDWMRSVNVLWFAVVLTKWTHDNFVWIFVENTSALFHVLWNIDLNFVRWSFQFLFCYLSWSNFIVGIDWTTFNWTVVRRVDRWAWRDWTAWWLSWIRKNELGVVLDNSID